MKNILIIEDDADIIWVYRETLTEEGYIVQEAENSKTALSIIKKSRLDLILLDIMLPGGLNGLDLLKKLKVDKKTSKIPVIMLTNLDGTQKKARKLGCEDYILKVNISLDDLVKKVKKYLPPDKN